MARIACILAATDFSPGADRAVRRAASLTSSLSGTLHVIHVLPPRELLAQFLPPPSEKEIAALRTRADEALHDRIRLIAAMFSVTPSWALFHGQAHRAILDAGRMLAADIVVIGAQGEHGGSPSSEMTIGETALKLAQRCGAPILLVRREPKEPYRTIIACAKGERIDRRVIGWANELSPGNLLHVVSAYTVPYEGRLRDWGASASTIDVYATREREHRTRYLSDTLSEMQIPAARVRLHVERDAPLKLILRSAAEFSADLVIVGRRRQPDPLGGGSFGSVARHVAFLAPMDVLIVPPEPANLEASSGDADLTQSRTTES